jgi:hypothetical protein
MILEYAKFSRCGSWKGLIIGLAIAVACIAIGGWWYYENFLRFSVLHTNCF